MILKTLDFRQGKEQNCVFDEWNYFDNITSASNYFDEGSQMTALRCTFRDGNTVTFAIPYVAYLMSDTGKTIEKIYGASKEGEKSETDYGTYKTLQDAADMAMRE